MRKEGLLLILVILLIGCSTSNECVPAGCSSQLCVPVDEASSIITTCEFKEEYTCLALTECDLVNSTCQWIKNEDYLKCLEGVKG